MTLQVAEFDTTENLLRDPNSKFAKMILASSSEESKQAE